MQKVSCLGQGELVEQNIVRCVQPELEVGESEGALQTDERVLSRDVQPTT